MSHNITIHNYFTLDNILQVSVVHPNGIFAETFLVPLTGLSTTLVMTTFTELQNGHMTWDFDRLDGQQQQQPRLMQRSLVGYGITIYLWHSSPRCCRCRRRRRKFLQRGSGCTCGTWNCMGTKRAQWYHFPPPGRLAGDVCRRKLFGSFQNAAHVDHFGCSGHDVWRMSRNVKADGCGKRADSRRTRRNVTRGTAAKEAVGKYDWCGRTQNFRPVMLLGAHKYFVVGSHPGLLILVIWLTQMFLEWLRQKHRRFMLCL